MEDEIEIDVIGDFDTPNLLSEKLRKIYKETDHRPENMKEIPHNRHLLFLGTDENIIRLTKTDENQEAEMEVDIEGDTDSLSSIMESHLEYASNNCKSPGSSPVVCKAHYKKRIELPSVNSKYIKSLQERMTKVFKLPHPTAEIVMDQTQISDEEQDLFPEFFCTIETYLINRYLKIRSHILNCWMESRPSYLSVTEIRKGLKNCGHKNLIARVHTYLEMKGAINFGCNRCWYVKHLKMSGNEMYIPQEEYNKESEENWATSVVDKNWKQQTEISPAIGYGDGGITLMHDDAGSITKVIISKHSKTSDVINSPVAKEDETRQLIYCKRFPSEESVPFQLCFYLEAVLVAEVHCYSSDLAAAKGLLLGWHDMVNRILHVTSCVPIAATGLTTCDWKSGTSNSQSSSSNQQNVVGWYFSHPISIADSSVINQPMHADLQSLFTKSASDPFIMLVLSPYSCSKKRCITTVKGYPYFISFKIVFTEDICIFDIIKKMNEAISKGNHKIQFNKKCEHLNNKTYGQLCYESIRRLLDSTIKAVPSDLKEELIMATKYLVGFNNFID